MRAFLSKQVNPGINTPSLDSMDPSQPPTCANLNNPPQRSAGTATATVRRLAYAPSPAPSSTRSSRSSRSSRPNPTGGGKGRQTK
eukprot:606060-Amorphochlora_amoeboformis.AAC.1